MDASSRAYPGKLAVGAVPRTGSSQLLLLLGLALLSGASVARADRRLDQRRQASQLVAEALHREIYGMQDERQELLREALDIDPDQALARWHLAEVWVRGQWVPAEEVQQLPGLQKKRELYERMRARAPATPEGHLALANWCADKGLPSQEFAHLHGVVQLVPDHLEARNRLGHIRVEGGWIERDALWGTALNRQLAAENVRKWADPLSEIRRDLVQRSQQKRDCARDRLLAIREASAIPALEAMIATDVQDVARLGLEALGSMGQREASLALARIALFHPSQIIRDEAIQRLQPRRPEGFIPALLAELSTPVESRWQAVVVNGGIHYRHAFYSERQHTSRLDVNDTHYAVQYNGTNMIRLPGNTLGAFQLVAVDRVWDPGMAVSLAMAIRARDRLQSTHNAYVQEINRRIGRVLRGVSGRQDLDDPRAWWSWWSEQNEMTQSGRKYQDVRHWVDEQAVVSRFPQTIYYRQQMSCFVAGTPVLTITGLRPVEELRIGDSVLAQDVETGRLDYQPVLATTQRPEAEILRITTADGEVLQATGGHPFWVSGEGWIHARKLESGMCLHTLRGSVCVSDVVVSPPQPTYNLVVAHYRTYFVGNDHVLCHDNTLFEATNAVIPGFFVD